MRARVGSASVGETMPASMKGTGVWLLLSSVSLLLEKQEGREHALLSLQARGEQRGDGKHTEKIEFLRGFG